MQPLSPEAVEAVDQPVGKEALIIGGKKHNKTYRKKRHGNKSLTAWVKFVKKVAREEHLTYRDAMMRAKVRKDKGEKWMKGGENGENGEIENGNGFVRQGEIEKGTESEPTPETMGGKRHNKSKRNSKKRRGTKKRR